MKKLPFVIIRLIATSIVVAICYYVFQLSPLYLTITAIGAYALFDILGYPLYNFFKTRLNFRYGTEQAHSKGKNTSKTTPKKAKELISNPNDIMSFFSLNRRLDFIVYFDAPTRSEHEVLMWIPYLSALRRNYVIVLRGKEYEAIFKKYSLPVILISKLADLEKIVDAGVKFAFYVNNGMRNTHMVRYNEITHIQLLHGDSDKPASYNPISIMYDYLFVAGQMAIDRYANNQVKIPSEKFEIVGRPQTEELKRLSNHEAFLNKKIKTILYTTTWAGFQEKTNFSSLVHAKEIVQHLIDKGFRVIFRPHPHSYGDTGQAQVINEIAELLADQTSNTGISHCISNNPEFNYIYKSSTECINAADILISDISSIISDWLFTAKPFIMIDTHKDKEKFLKENPLAKGAYYIDTDISNLEEILINLCNADPLYEERLKTRLYACGMTLTDDPLEKFVSVTNDVFSRHESDSEE